MSRLLWPTELQSQINTADDYVAEFATLGLPSRQIVIMRVNAGYVSSDRSLRRRVLYPIELTRNIGSSYR